MQLRGPVAACAAVLALSGCGFGLVGSSAPATYDLQAPPIEKVHGTHTSQLLIYPPVAVKTIDTDEILIKTSNGRIAYFSGVAWGDRLPRLFQARLVEALANSGAFRAILTNQDRVVGDYSLAIEIRDFEIEATPAGRRAVIDIYVKLVDERNNAVVTTRRFQTQTPAPDGDNIDGDIHALNSAFQRIALEVVSWVSRRSA
jgi:cholesterol transport system auxiliary component